MTEISTESKKRIFLVDDHPLVREWLTNLINLQPDLVVCGDTGEGQQVLQAVEKLRPEVIVLDLTLARGSGLDVLKDLQIHFPEVKVLVLSMHDEATYAERALRAGARGYVMKRDSTKNIIAALRDILRGELFVSPEFRSVIMGRFLKGKSGASPIEQLSDRELEVFRMIGQGVETRKVAEMLGISIKTVQVYCSRIREKLGITNATELLREAVRWWDKQQTTTE